VIEGKDDRLLLPLAVRELEVDVEDLAHGYRLGLRGKSFGP
jgi:hypothetical protein